MILADNGSNWYVSGAPTRAGRTTSYTRSVRSTGADFEVVDTSSLRP